MAKESAQVAQAAAADSIEKAAEDAARDGAAARTQWADEKRNLEDMLAAVQAAVSTAAHRVAEAEAEAAAHKAEAAREAAEAARCGAEAERCTAALQAMETKTQDARQVAALKLRVWWFNANL
jgi:hypothetical protein